MSVEIHPRKLRGPWDKGFALDAHTVSSTYLGDDKFGRPRFDTKRSAIGELLYRLKYKIDRVEALEGAFSVSQEHTRGRSLLLFDDLHGSGATASAITEALKAGGAKAVYMLTLTTK